MINKGIYALTMVLVTLVAFSCNFIDRTQINPAYLIIDDISISTTSAQGAPTDNFTDVWISVDGFLLGVFELPARIPIIIENPTTRIRVSPGFRNNGENSRAFSYELVNSIFIEEAIAPGDLIERDFVFSYRDDAIFDFVEGFEGGTQVFSLDLDGDENTIIEQSSEDVRSGTQSGKIMLTPEAPSINVATSFAYDGILNAGADSYFELDYKNDIPIVIGVIYEEDGLQVTESIIVLNTQEEWNKIYVDYTLLLASPSVENYRIFIGASIESTGLSSGTIFLDNLKFVHL